MGRSQRNPNPSRVMYRGLIQVIRWLMHWHLFSISFWGLSLAVICFRYCSPKIIMTLGGHGCTLSCTSRKARSQHSLTSSTLYIITPCITKKVSRLSQKSPSRWCTQGNYQRLIYTERYDSRAVPWPGPLRILYHNCSELHRAN